MLMSPEECRAVLSKYKKPALHSVRAALLWKTLQGQFPWLLWSSDNRGQVFICFFDVDVGYEGSGAASLYPNCPPLLSSYMFSGWGQWRWFCVVIAIDSEAAECQAGSKCAFPFSLQSFEHCGWRQPGDQVSQFLTEQYIPVLYHLQ